MTDESNLRKVGLGLPAIDPSQTGTLAGKQRLEAVVIGASARGTAPGDLVQQGFKHTVGPAFPTNPAPSAGDTHFRTDLGFDCFYDGTRWLTADVESISIQEFTASISGNSVRTRVRTDFAISPTRLAITTSQTGAPDASNYYTGVIRSLNVPLTALTTVYSFSTQGDAAGVFVSKDGNSSSAAPANYGTFDINVTKVGPNAVTVVIQATIYYRLIIT